MKDYVYLSQIDTSDVAYHIEEMTHVKIANFFVVIGPEWVSGIFVAAEDESVLLIKNAASLHMNHLAGS